MSKKRSLPEDNYEVGYGKPPKENRFLKGRSGNPKGRPNGSKNKTRPRRLMNLLKNEFYREIKVYEETGSVDMSIAQAIFRSISVKAAKGDYRSQKLMLDLVRTAEADEADLEDGLPIITVKFVSS
ncbi:MAG: hypothetical protein HOH80_12330 [Rhodospirillaceae bacterium]|nr:hypothetical protein [Rhodospirillaceae bacterium]MBT5839777.1 hypothetical protein [Rhodospirillaceae bacterium]